MTAVPAETPVTAPVEDPTVAIPVLALVHDPPAGIAVNVVEDPAHTVDAPLSAGVPPKIVT